MSVFVSIGDVLTTGVHQQQYSLCISLNSPSATVVLLILAIPQLALTDHASGARLQSRHSNDLSKVICTYSLSIT